MDSDLDWISHQALEELTGAHRTTVRRWKRLAPTGWLPAWLRRLVNTIHRGRLDEIHAAWRGWMINKRDGELVTPEGVCITQGQIRALPQLQELRRALEAELLKQRAELASALALAKPPVLATWRQPAGHQRTRTSSARSSSTACRRRSCAVPE